MGLSTEALSWLLFLSVLVNQMGRNMVPAVMTSVLADTDMPVECAPSLFLRAEPPCAHASVLLLRALAAPTRAA